MERRNGEPDAGDSLKQPAGAASPEDELWLAFGKAVGFTVAAGVLLVGGGILLIVIAGIFLSFVYGR